ncbi:MAG: hypothetical protein WC384_13600 [Prolixibacteraceae bacterium]|jgi:hypothetical protein
MPSSKYSTKLILLSLLLFLISQSVSFGQSPKLKSNYFLDNWKFEFKGGVGMLLSEVPDKYLDRINNVNIPLKIPGPAVVFSIRKGINGHIEMGYQFDYMSIHGEVVQDARTYDVKTKALGHSYILLYNFKNTNNNDSRLNYNAYYRVGALSLKNDPKEKVGDGSQIPTDPVAGNEFIKNVAVITGIGLGINYQLAGNLSLIASAELNRSADAAADVYKIYKIFYHSENTVNNFTSLTAGLRYTLNPSDKKKSTYHSSHSSGAKTIQQSKTKKKSRKALDSNYSIWYKSKGKK